MRPNFCTPLVGTLAILAVCLTSNAIFAQPGTPGTPVRDGHVEAQLIVCDTALVPGQTATLGLRLQMDEHWHTYWANPGDAGLATSIEWQLPEGFTAHDIAWPAPEYYEIGGLATYGYESEIVLPVQIAVPADAPVGEPVAIKATADWLVCKDICIPGSAELSLTLPVVGSADEAKPDPRWSDLFAWAANRAPQDFEDAAIRAESKPHREYLLTVEHQLAAPADGEDLSLRFFPDDAEQIEMAGQQAAAFSHNGPASVTLPMSVNQARAERLTGVLVYKHADDLRVYRVDTPVIPDTAETNFVKP